MDENAADNTGFVNVAVDEDSRSAVNSLILDYYKKFGRKRDLEHFFSLSTAQSDIQDPTSLFWRKMKTQTDSSDSGEGKTGSSTELCRISIKYTAPDPSTSQDDNSKSKDDSVSPPIITEEPTLGSATHTDNESIKSDDNNSQKSTDAHLDTSINKPFSPTSSITSQRKLEWDSLGDVGYGNESERKASSSGLSTLERLALHQQYSNNDTKQDTQFGPPTSHSTPVELNILQKGNVKKTTKFYKKDVDLVEFNVPYSSEKNPTAINVNLTKHISFNVDKDGEVTVDNTIKKDNIKLTSDKVSVETEMTPQVRIDKEIQTSLTNKELQKKKQLSEQKCPILIHFNTLRKRSRKKKLRTFKKKVCRSKAKAHIHRLPLEKSGDQVSEAESFEYMPGHIYNQNQMKNNITKDSNSVGNKSSLESSIVFTTDSSKASKNSFTKDLEKSIDFLKEALQSKYDNSNLKEKLIKEVVQRLLKTRYRDDDSATVFLSGLSFNSKRLGLSKTNHTTTSTSDGNTFDSNVMANRPKKSILRVDKFNPNGMASTSQSTPNLHTLAKSDKPEKMTKTPTFSNTESDFSSRERNSSDTAAKMSSEELYKKYLEALKREHIHKKRLKDKETLLKKKLVSSDTCLKTTQDTCNKSHDRLIELIKDLTRNNIDDGSGDASKLEGGSSSNIDKIRKQKSHSVFTLASGKPFHAKHSKVQRASHNVCQNVITSEAGCSKIANSCCCSAKQTVNAQSEVVESAVQVKGSYEEDTRSQRDSKLRHYKENATDLVKPKQLSKSNRNSPRTPDKVILKNTNDVEYVCLCSNKTTEAQVPERLLIYKCSRIGQHDDSLADAMSKASSSVGVQWSSDCLCSKQITETKLPMMALPDKEISLNCEPQSSSLRDFSVRKTSTSSQTNVNLDLILRRGSSDRSVTSISNEKQRSGFIEEREDTVKNKCEKHNAISKLLREGTRWIQTEISIDPKISDPTLSDVNFINDSDCVKLISEQERNRIEPKIFSRNQLSYENVKKELFKRCTYTQTSTSLHENQTNTDNNYNFLNNAKGTNYHMHEFIEENEMANLKVRRCSEDKFSIPIQGTNMTLVVSLGSNAKTISDEETKTDLKTNGLIKHQVQLFDKGTSFGGDRSKGVQYKNTDIFTQIDNRCQQLSRDKDGNQVNSSTRDNIGETIIPYRKSYLVNTFDTEDGLKYNTYPKNHQNVKKPFLRSNTDISYLESYATNVNNEDKRNIEVQKDFSSSVLSKADDITAIGQSREYNHTNLERSSKEEETREKNKESFKNYQHLESKKSRCESKCDNEDGKSKDPVLNMIQDITKRYTKKDMEKSKRKKCFKEIFTVLNYLLDTEESTDKKDKCSSSSATDSTSTIDQSHEKKSSECLTKKTYVDKGVQLSMKKIQKQKSCMESSDDPTSSKLPTTSTDSTTCEVLNKIRKECEKYHQKRCKSGQKKCDESSSASVNGEKYNRDHYCSCRHKCKGHKAKSTVEKVKKKCVAYNLIIQTSDSMASEETECNAGARPLQNIVVKIPPKQKHLTNAPFKEVSAKIENKLTHCSPRYSKVHKSRSLPNDSEMSSEDFNKKMRTCTVRDYLEINRPDFVEKSTKRQDCLKFINQTRSNERTSKRKLLSLQLERQQTLNALSSEEIQHLARELGAQLRRKKVAPKFISEREMKEHSEKIYKSLPEVMQKKEEMKKENMKKTNLLMANIFKKNLQKKTLRGSVNLSNYSTVIKI